MTYFRPLVMTDPARTAGALPLAGGWCWFDRVEVLERGRAPTIIALNDVPADVVTRLTAPRAAIAGMVFDSPRLMGILNVTPDSFSDGGRFDRLDAALAQARAMSDDIDIFDVGGESTRPGAAEVSEEQEISRVRPVIEAMRAELLGPISIDTRKAGVAMVAMRAGAELVNDVSALRFDPAMASSVKGAPVCLMHSIGTPETMQLQAHYDDVVLDVYDHLAERIAVAEAAGIARASIFVDPGIGFGKTQAHNLALLRRVSLFHSLGCAILLGASRKRFIGSIGGTAQANERMPGSVAVALLAAAQGVQVLRVHDTSQTAQALRLARAQWIGEDSKT